MTLKFVFVAVCFAIAAVSFFFCRNKKDWLWLTLGLLFTVAADYFLVIHNRHLPGVAVFSFVHMCYILRVLQPKARKLALFIVPFLAGAIFIAFMNEALLVLAGIYAGLFALNIAINIKFCKINKPLVLTGLVLFMLCDINVMLFNLPRELGVSIYFPWAFTLIWVFYLPSQLLLAVSAVAYPRAKE